MSGDEVASMRDDWPALMGRAQKAGEEYVAALRQVGAAVDGAPVHPAVKDMMRTWVGHGQEHVAAAPDVNAATRQADEALWETHVDAPRPNNQAWGH